MSLRSRRSRRIGHIPTSRRMSPSRTAALPCNRRPSETQLLLPIYGSSEQTLQSDLRSALHPTNLSTVALQGSRSSRSARTKRGPAGRPAKAGCPERRAGGAENGGLSFAFLVFQQARGSGGRLRSSNFSDLQAGELAFDTRLSLELGKNTARRMLQYAATLANRPGSSDSPWRTWPPAPPGNRLL